MDNGGVFSAEIEVEEGLRERDRAESSRVHPRHKRGVQSHSFASDITNEESPLLSSSNDNQEEIGDGDGENDSPEEWVGIVDFKGLPWWKKPSIFWLLPPFLLFTLAFGGIVVPKLNLISDLICNDYFAEKEVEDPIGAPGEHFDRCRDDAVSARISLFVLYGNLCSGLLSAITSPKLGALSDRYGRKKLLVFTTLGILMSEVLTILAAKYPETFHVNVILVGYALDGLCGSFILGMALAQSYGTDCTPPQKRNVAFGYFYACLFTGIAIGPVLAGWVIKKTDNVLLVFYTALGMHLVFITFLLVCIPESLSKARQEAARERYRQEMERMGPASDWINQLRSVNLFRPLRILYPTGPGSSSALRRNLILLAATDTIMFSVAMGAMSVVIIYVRLQFGWLDWESSKFTSIVNGSRVFALLVALPLITRLVRGKPGTAAQRNSGSDRFDLYVIRFAIFFDVVGYLGYSLARDGALFTAAGAFAALGGVGSPALGAALTKHVPPDRVGQLLGATGLLHAIARVVGPTIFNGIYYETVGSFRQTVFVCLTATFGAAFVCSWFVRPHVYLEDDQSASSRSSQVLDADVEH